MVPIMNALKIDCAVAGNHDFDWSAPHFLNLVKDSNYPWLLSNIIDEDKGDLPNGLHAFQVFERCGARIGLIGLVEEDWIKTISSWPPNYKYKDMKTVALDLSKQLRDPDGPHKCDIIIALTHSRLPNDIQLAKDLHARIGSGVVSEHGCDIILGGHDHFYYVSKFVQDATPETWKGYDMTQSFLGAEEDDGVLVIKSGTDFRDLSEIHLELEDAPEGSIRRKYISAVHGSRHTTQPNSQASEKVTGLLKTLVGHIEESLSRPVCKLDAVLDCHSDVVRIGESASGNWFADVIFHAYDDALCIKGVGGTDAVFICGGTIRGDSSYGPGNFTVGNIMEILPFQDPIIVLQMDGQTIWTALESSLSAWPAQEGRFPVVSGLQVEWDSSKPKGQRVLSVELLQEAQSDDVSEGSQTPNLKTTTIPVKNEKGGRMYNVITRQYMAQGFDGYDAFKGCKMLVDDENGRIMSDLIRHYLLGYQYINMMKGLTAEQTPSCLSAQSSQLIATEQKKHTDGTAKHGKARWTQIVRKKVIKTSARDASNRYRIAGAEHMSGIDCVDGAKIRSAGNPSNKDNSQDMSSSLSPPWTSVLESDLVVVSPRIDGRLKDVARAQVST